MKKKYLTILFTIFCMSLLAQAVKAQKPNWKVNSHDYVNNMTITGVINLNYTESADENDMIGAFVNGECRGVQNLTFDNVTKRYVAFLMIYSNENSETVQFKVYDASEEIITEIPRTIKFKVNAILGSPAPLYTWSNPTLSSESVITDFLLPGQVKKTTIKGTNIYITMPYDANLDSLIATYTASERAKVTVGENLQTSGISVNNFNLPVKYRVLSDDETSEEIYTVTVEVYSNPSSHIFLSSLLIPESMKKGEEVAVFKSDDVNLQNTYSYSLVKGEGDTDNGSFTINDTTLILNTVLDFEKQTKYAIRIQVNDNSGRVFEKQFVINIIDENDEIPHFESMNVNISKTKPVNTVIGSVKATDADISPEFKNLRYRILSGNTDDVFEIDSLNGDIKIIRNLNYETIKHYELVVNVEDGLNSFSNTVKVFVVNDDGGGGGGEISVFSSIEVSIAEIEPINKVICHSAKATDTLISPEYTDLRYRFLSGNINNTFEIDSLNGDIKIVKKLDYEKITQYELKVNVENKSNNYLYTVKVYLEDVNDETPVFDSKKIHFTRTVSVNTVICSIKATDADISTKFRDLRYSFLSGNINGVFKIDKFDGKIKVVKNLDSEIIKQYELLVNVDDGLNSFSDTVKVFIKDIDDDKLSIFNTKEIKIPETEPVNTIICSEKTIGTLILKEFKNLRYQLMLGNTNGNFEIDSLNGDIKIIKNLDYETTQKYELSVNLENESNIFIHTVKVFLEDVNDEIPVFDSQKIQIPENKPVNTVIGSVKATDADISPEFKNIRYRILSGNTDDVFEIDRFNGDIKIIKSLDYEKITHYELEVNVEDGLNSFSNTVKIFIEDIDDDQISVSDFKEIYVPENKPINTIICSAKVNDTIISPEFGDLRYRFLSGNTNNTFEIDSLNGDIKIVEKLDYEKITQYELKVSIENKSNNFSYTVKVFLEDVNDETPVFDSKKIHFPGTVSVNTIICLVKATDADISSKFRDLRYSFLSGNINGVFKIDKFDGKIKVVKNLDFETIKQYELLVNVDDGLNSFSDTVKVFIKDIDDDKLSIFNTKEIKIPETEPINTIICSEKTIGTLILKEFKTLRYQFMLGNTNGNFEIDSLNGDIKIIKNLDYETTQKYELSVNLENESNIFIHTVKVFLKDVNDEIPVFYSQKIQIPENKPVNTIIGSVKATDADISPEFKNIRYRILSGNTDDVFEIDRFNGDIKIIKKLDYEKITHYELEVNVEDGLNSFSNTVKIFIEDIDDQIAVFDSQEIHTPETVPINTLICSAKANNTPILSSLKDLRFRFVSGNTNEVFEIDSLNGNIKTIKNLDYEKIKQYELKVSVGNEGNKFSYTVKIFLEDINDEIPVFDSKEIHISKNEPVNTVIHLVNALDKDVSQKFRDLRYRFLSGNNNHVFKIDILNGDIQIIKNLNHQTLKHYELVVNVEDGLNSFSDTIKVFIENVNNQIPVFDSQEIHIPETEYINTVICSVKSNDFDNILEFKDLRFSFISGNTNNVFEIDRLNGDIRIIENLDYEKIKQYELLVSVENELNIFSYTVKVFLEDVNDEIPTFDSQEIHIAETKSINTVICSVKATDADISPKFRDLRYSFLSGNTKNVFEIDRLNGDIKIIKKLDYETTKEYELIVNVEDGLNKFSDIVKIFPKDINDETPVFADTNFTISKHIVNGKVIAQLYATDLDAESKLSFKIKSGNDDDIFYLTEDGELTVVGNPGYENKNIYNLSVMVSDGVNDVTKTVTIYIINKPESYFEADKFISPNGDGINDYWKIKNPDDYSKYHFSIFDNVGQKVYESYGYHNYWDGTCNGKKLPIGVYYYHVVSDDCQECEFVGTISLIR